MTGILNDSAQDESWPYSGLDPRASAKQERLREIAWKIMGGPRPEPLGLYVFRAGEPGEALFDDVAKSVYGEEFGDPPDLLDAEFGPYKYTSVMLCVLDHRRRIPAGVMRLILPSAAGLKDLNEMAAKWDRPYEQMFADTGIELDLDHTWNLSTLAVAPAYRHASLQGLITVTLVQATTQLGLRCGVTTLIAALYRPVLRMLRWKLQIPFAKFVGVDEGPYPYDYSPVSLLTWFHVEDWFARMAKRDPVLFDIMVNAKGIEPTILAPDWDVEAERVRDVAVLADLRAHLH